MHPYSEAYYRREVQRMHALRPLVVGSAHLARESGPRPADGYMYSRTTRAALRDIPVLRLDDGTAVQRK